MKETWKPIPGMESFYEASSLGRIRSISREVNTGNGFTRTAKGKVLAPQICGHRYYRVTIAMCGTKIGHAVHRLVAKAFIANPGNLPEVNHKNGNRLDNRAENLEWCTRSSNINHAIGAGLKPPGLGSRHGMSKLTEALVLEIRSALCSGEPGYVLAERYGVTKSTISSIKTGATWGHV